MELILPLESVFRVSRVLKSSDIIIQLSEILAQKAETNELYGKKQINDDTRSDKNQILGDVKEVKLLHKGVEEFVNDILISELGYGETFAKSLFDYPERHFLIAATVATAHFVIQNKNRLFNAEIEEILLAVSGESISGFCEKFILDQKDLLDGLHDMLGEFWGRLNNDLGAYQYTNILMLFIAHLMEKWEIIKEYQFEIFKHADLLLNILNFNIDPALFKTPDLSQAEVKKLSRIKFSVLSHDEIKDWKKNKVTLHVVTNTYFIEHLRDLNEILSDFDNVEGVSLYNEDRYSSEFLKVVNIVNGLLQEKISKEEVESIEHNLNFIEEIDGKLYKILNEAMNSKQGRYIYAVCKDEYIRSCIVKYCENRLSAEFESVYAFNIKDKYVFDNPYLVVIGMEELRDEHLMKVWRTLRQKVYGRGFVIFFGKRTPNFIITPEEYSESKQWYYDDKKVFNNISGVFHSFLCSYNETKSKITENTISYIKANKYSPLLEFPELNLKILKVSVRAIADRFDFNYDSPRSWYYLRQEYMKNLADSKEKHELSSGEEIIRFEFREDEWRVFDNRSFDFEEPNSPALLYLVLTLKYHQIYNIGIKYSHLRTITKYYLWDDDDKRKFIENYKEEIKKNPNADIFKEDSKVDNTSIKIKLHGKDTKNLHSKLEQFCKDHIKFRGGRVNFISEIKGQATAICSYELLNFRFEEELFTPNYKDLIIAKCKQIRNR